MDAIALSLACVAGLTVGVILALPVDVSSCHAPGDPRFAGCNQLVWGRALMLVTATTSVGAVLGYLAVGAARLYPPRGQIG